MHRVPTQSINMKILDGILIRSKTWTFFFKMPIDGTLTVNILFISE